MSWTARQHCCIYNCPLTNYKKKQIKPTRVDNYQFSTNLINTIRYDTIVEFNVDSKAEYTALSSTQLKVKNIK